MASSAPALKEDRPVFACGNLDYTLGDVLDAAHFRGELEPFWKQVLIRVEAEKRGQESDLAIDDEAVDSAAVAFRYTYDLITAEETEAWLEARGLTLAEFTEYFGRLEWEKEFAGQLAAPEIAFENASPEQRDLLLVDLILSGALETMATRLAWRIAAAQAAKDQPTDETLLEEDRAAFYERTGLTEATVADWLRNLGREQSWLEEMLAMEGVYRARCALRLTNEARERELSSVRLPLTRFEVEIIELESRDAAQEAFMCVRDDGMSMAQVAEEGRYPFHQTEMVLEQVSDDLQQKFLSLTPGSLLEPTEREDGFLLTRILDKKEPKLDDARVRERVEQRILARYFSDLSSGRIQWRIAMNGAE